ncbi:MAG: type II toxin-antitoxin system VapC family toxin [Microscillaceae bacterium]|jgi:predicted nucleic acid-binding protein|nr:type II toxin-antitoxin system VapC family toxin [Microscillaceae bacterium]
MGTNLTLLDTGVLITYFRATKKQNTWFWQLAGQYDLAIASITEYEFRVGFKNQQDPFLQKLLPLLNILPFDSTCASKAVEIYQSLKNQNQLIPANDLFIALVALVNDLPLATLNTNHFNRLADLKLLTQ